MNVSTPTHERQGFLTWKRGSLIFVAMLFVFCELALRVLNLPSLDQKIDPLAFQLERSPVEAHPYLAYANKPEFEANLNSGIQVRHNSIGLRGPEVTWEKSRRVTRVLCLGDASTYGSGIEDESATWPARLTHYLEVSRPGETFEVLNAGTPGYSTFEGLIDMAVRGIDLQPDILVVTLAANDARSALHGDPLPDNSHYRSNWPTERVSKVERLLETSYLYRIARSRFTDWSEERSQFAGGLIELEEESNENTTVHDPSSRGFTNYRRNLESLIALARMNGMEVLIATQAADPDDFTGSEEAEALHEALVRMNAIAKNTAQEHGVYFVDTALILSTEAARQREDTGAESLFGYRTALRPPGADLFALTVADAIYRTSKQE